MSSPMLKAPACLESLVMSDSDIAAFKPKSDFVRTLLQRGYIHQCSDLEGLDAAAASGVVPAYIGFDATATSLHVGSLIQIMLLRRLQQTGHKPIVVMGGGTTKVGDPSGKDTQRQMLTDAQIQANIGGILTVFDRFLTFGDGPADAVVVDNDLWLSKFGYVEFLREFGPHFTINRMLTFDSVKLRLDREQPLTFLEFNYMLMQAVDFLELSRRNACRLQTTASGAKMGKTAAGAMWLNADLMSPYDYWQFWRNTEDADVGRFMKLFTDLPLDEIARLEVLKGSEINEAKKVLADEAATLLHGADAARTARAAAEAAFEQGLSSADLPTHQTPKADLEAGVPLANLVADAGLAGSRGEARRLAQGGGLKVNDKAEPDAGRLVTLADLVDGAIKIAAGKKKIVLVKPV